MSHRLSRRTAPRTTRAAFTLAATAVLALGLSACGGGSPAGESGATTDAASPSGTDSGGEGLREVQVSVMPIAPSAAFQYGLEEGIFEEHGFDVEINNSVSGAATLPAVSNGQIHFDIGNPMSVGIAVDQGLDLKITNGFANSLAEGDDIAGVVVREDSGIEDWADLAGKQTAVVSLMGHNTLTIADSAEQDGADPTEVGFTEMGFPDMAPQLGQGNVDAIFVPEPFLSQALAEEGNTLLGYNFQNSIPGLPTLVTYTSGKLIEEDPELVADFTAAMDDVLTQAQANRPDAMMTLVDFLGIPEPAAQNMKTEEWDGEVRTEQLDRLWELAVDHEYIDAAPEDIYYQR